MKLYSGSQCLFSHACRFVLKEKEIDCDVVFTTDKQVEDAVGELNPYGETPTLADRDLVLYDVVVVNEYLDERFPHPPLMPSDPTTRSQARVMISRLRRDWLDDVQNRMASGVKLEKTWPEACQMAWWRCPTIFWKTNTYWARISVS